MDEYLQKTIDGRYINKYLEKVSRQLKKNVANVHVSIVEKFQEKSKTEMQSKKMKNKIDVLQQCLCYQVEKNKSII